MKLGKQKSSGSLNGAKGGKTHMFGKSGVAPRQPGISAPVNKQPFNKDRPKGGGKHMFKKSGARSSPPERSAPPSWPASRPSSTSTPGPTIRVPGCCAGPSPAADR